MKKLLGSLLLLVLAAATWWVFRPAGEPVPRSSPGGGPVPAAGRTSFKKAASQAKAREVVAPLTSPAAVEAMSAAVVSAVQNTSPRIEAPPPPPVKIPADYVASLQQGPELQEADEVAQNIRSYGQRFGGNPVGTNAEIVQALRGANPGNANYLPQSGQRLNSNGELIDKWGTPYFFHANSSTEMEVRSAGPDRRLFTPDDIVTK